MLEVLPVLAKQLDKVLLEVVLDQITVQQTFERVQQLESILNLVPQQALSIVCLMKLSATIKAATKLMAQSYTTTVPQVQLLPSFFC